MKQAQESKRDADMTEKEPDAKEVVRLRTGVRAGTQSSSDTELGPRNLSH
jgi:hypothetical protein